MPYKGVIFDLDGTLLDTLEDLGTSLNRVLRRKGYPTHSMETYRQFVGEGAGRLVTRALPEDQRGDGVVKECLQAYKREYSNCWNVHTKPYEGIGELLDELTHRNIKMAVLSNKPHKYTVMCVSELLPNWRFDVVFGEQHHVPRKPNPAGALEIVSMLGCSPENFVFLGDTAIDIRTGLAAGMFAVGVLWGFRSKEELEESGAQALIQSPSELLAVMNM